MRAAKWNYGESAQLTDLAVEAFPSDDAGAGDHDTTLSHTGSGGTFAITQDGAHDSTVSMTTSGAGHSVTVTVDD